MDDSCIEYKGLYMNTVLVKEVISDIFKEFPQLNKMWIKGDLETFYDATFVIEDCVHEGALVRFLYQHFDFEEHCVPVVFSESFMRGRESFNDSYIECRREDYL